MKFLLIGIFGLIGVFARYGIGTVVYRNLSHGFPYATFLINVIGCFFIGLVYILGNEKNIFSEDMRIALMVGLLGGFTTFSAYSLETFMLLRAQQYGLSALYFLGSGFLGLLATYAGFIVGKILI